MITKPMLAAAIDDFSILKFPLWVTPKLDGIRALKVDGKLVSRTFKPIPNNHIRATLEAILPDGIDGEIMSGSNFQETTTAVMTQKGEPEFIYHAFDYVKDALDKEYVRRVVNLSSWYGDFIKESEYASSVSLILPQKCETIEELLEWEAKFIERGHEGLMARTGDSPYKCGRASKKNQWLIKIKRFLDSEAEILALEERFHNANEAKKDNFGRTERSSHKDNLVPTNSLGAFLVRDLTTNLEFRVGTGLTEQQRVDFWQQPELVGQIIKYKYFPVGVKELPRHPVYLGFRHKDDM